MLGPGAGPAPHDTPVSGLLAGGLEYGVVWSRPQLSRAIESGDLSVATLHEAALHAGLYAGVMAGRVIDDAISDVAAGPREPEGG